MLEYEVGHQERNVVASLTQGRQVQLDHIQTVKEISSKNTGGGKFLQITVAGGNHTRAYFDHLGAANRHHFTFLQHPQKLHLQSRARLAHFVEKDSAFAGVFKNAALVGGRARERALNVTKQFRLEQRFRQRSAIDGDERRASARTMRMYRSRDQFFAGARFARHQDRSGRI